MTQATPHATLPVVHTTFVIERRFAQSPDRVFAAFADPAQKRRWFTDAEHHEVELYEQDFRVGGAELARFRFSEGTPFPGARFTNRTTYEDIVPGRRIVFSSTMEMNENRISVALVTVELSPAGAGTELLLTHQAAFLEGADGPQMREQGWRTLMNRLEKLWGQ